MLDAIHYLSFTKSAVNNSDAQNVCHGENYFVINGEFERDSKTHMVRCQFDGKKKKIVDDNTECTRFSDHIGRYPVVMIAPQDITLIWEAGEGRRRLFDQWISQFNKQYIENLVGYNYQLKQRNGLLKEAQSFGRVDLDLIGSYNEKLAAHAEFIYSERKKFISALNPEFQKIYSWLCHSEENAEIVYRSQLEEGSIRKMLEDNLDRELAGGRTLSGIHLDEYQFLLNNYEVRKTGSQGQQKSFLISLKVMELTQLTEKLKFPPVVLLDDIFDKMDNDRIARFMELLFSRNVDQFLLTDANPERASKIFNI
ncbi:DNA replication and repair protein RecF, partial [bacterium]|nr:DNA replication and repair protein RecF [bacterium]